VIEQEEMASPRSLPKPGPVPAVTSQLPAGDARGRLRWLAYLTLLLVLGFGKPLNALVQFAWHSELYSYILLIPFISLYLVWLNRRSLALESRPVRVRALFPLILGCGILAAYWLALRAGWKPKPDDYLACMTLSFLSFFAFGCLLFFGPQTIRKVAVESKNSSGEGLGPRTREEFGVRGYFPIELRIPPGPRTTNPGQGSSAAERGVISRARQSTVGRSVGKRRLPQGRYAASR
jgi:hypothetical protein